MLDNKHRYLQIAFNSDIGTVARILPYIPSDDRIFVEAGTPFLKREGMNGIKYIASFWSGHIIADLKVADGAIEEVNMARRAGATGATALGSAPEETLNLFIKRCKELNMISMIDMLGVTNPLVKIKNLKFVPDVIILHKGRDEESTKGKVIEYKHINKIKSKYNVIISAAGGVDLREARSAIFNGSNIVVVNIVSESDPWTGISTSENVAAVAKEFLDTIK